MQMYWILFGWLLWLAGTLVWSVCDCELASLTTRWIRLLRYLLFVLCCV